MWSCTADQAWRAGNLESHEAPSLMNKCYEVLITRDGNALRPESPNEENCFNNIMRTFTE